MPIVAKNETYTAEEAVKIDARTLIALSRQSGNLPLKSIGVRAQQSGHYVSPFKGRGMEFDEVRAYQPGDDIRTIDWKVTARSGKTHTKLYREERERPVLIWADLKSSMFFATRGAYKSIISARACALLAWSAVNQGDRLGGLIFSEQHHKEIRPKRGKAAVLHFIKELCRYPTWEHSHSKQNPQTLQHALGRLRRVAKPGSLIILSSDFKYLDEISESHLAQLSRHCDIVFLHISDPIEQQLPPAGWYRFSHNAQEIELATHEITLRQQYENRYLGYQQYLKKLCNIHKMHYLHLSTHQPILKTLQSGLGLR